MADPDTDVGKEKARAGIPEGLAGTRPRDTPPTKAEVIEPSKDEMNDARRRMGFQPRYNKGGMVKAGSPKITAPCKDSKTIKCL